MYRTTQGVTYYIRVIKKSYTAEDACALFRLSNLLEAELCKDSIHCIKWRFGIYLWAEAPMGQKWMIPICLL